MKKSILFILVLVGFTTCDLPEHYFESAPECVEQTQFADLGEPTSPDYQAQVLSLLETKVTSDFRYFFKTFLEEDGKSYMLTNFRNKEACFDVKVLVERWDKLAGMKRTNGDYYPNELHDVQWEIQEAEGKRQVIYIDMHRIID